MEFKVQHQIYKQWKKFDKLGFTNIYVFYESQDMTKLKNNTSLWENIWKLYMW